jgi:AraC-like DNA-binding protein
VRPPVAAEARHSWFQAKILELLSLHLFYQPAAGESLYKSNPGEHVHRHVRQALELLEGRLAEPLDLSDLADDVGCAPHYLSRLVKQDTAKTLSLHLRAMRIERAVQLLATHTHNVTEVALEVGYNSLSHFSKAFTQEQGLSPSAFLKRQH